MEVFGGTLDETLAGELSWGTAAAGATATLFGSPATVVIEDDDPTVPGDIDGDGDLADDVLCPQILSDARSARMSFGARTSMALGRIGIEKAIYILDSVIG